MLESGKKPCGSDVVGKNFPKGNSLNKDRKVLYIFLLTCL
jgi:hypothetical protein